MSDALDRLKRKKRPKVQPRTTRVDQESRDIQVSRHTDLSNSKASEIANSQDVSARTVEDIQTSRHIDIQTSRHIDIQKPALLDHTELQDPPNDSVRDIQVSRHIDIKTSRPSPYSLNEGVEELDVKRSTFRLEVGLIGRMQRLCQDRKISREVMIESMFEYMERNPKALEEAIGVAESKNAYRQQLANRKRAKAMIEKFGQ